MDTGRATAEPASRAGPQRRQPWWLPVVAVALAGRLFGLAVLAAVARWAPAPHGRTRPVPLATMLSIWDGGWYQRIAVSGYPAELPTEPDGAVAPNVWAFYPGFPLLLRGLSGAVDAPVATVSMVLNPILAGVAALLLYRLVADHTRRAPAGSSHSLDRPRVQHVLGDAAGGSSRGAPAGTSRSALAVVAVWSAAPTSPALSVLYAESFGAVLVFAALLLLARRSYLVACVPIGLLGLTRPLGVPMAATVGVLVVLRLHRWWRAGDPSQQPPQQPPQQTLRQPLHRPSQQPGPVAAQLFRDWRTLAPILTPPLAVGAVAGAAAVAWPAIASVVTSTPDAYLETMRAWRPGYSLTVFVPWWQLAGSGPGGLGAALALAGLLAAAAVSQLAGPGRRLPAEVRVWTGASLAYVMAVAAPTTSLLRYLLLAVGLWGALGLACRRTATLVGCIAGCAVLQVIWVLMVWYDVAGLGFPP